MWDALSDAEEIGYVEIHSELTFEPYHSYALEFHNLRHQPRPDL